MVKNVLLDVLDTVEYLKGNYPGGLKNVIVAGAVYLRELSIALFPENFSKRGFVRD